MARRKARTLTEVELEFMQVVWPEREVTTEQVRVALRRQGRGLSDGSVRKVLSILVEKGYLTRRREGRGFYYRAKVPEGTASRSMVLDLLKRAFGGSAALMMAALFDAEAVGDEEMPKIKKLIAEQERDR